MTPIPAPASLAAGDVLHHAAFGFAEVDSVLPNGARLRWEDHGPGHPVVVSAEALAGPYWRCHPDGLLARSVRDDAGARRLLHQDALEALARLLVDVQGPVRKEDARDWMLARRLFTAARFDAWWEAVFPLAAADARFGVTDGGLALADGVDASALGTWRRPPPEPGSLPGAALADVLRRSAESLARVHAGGGALGADLCAGPDGAVTSRDTRDHATPEDRSEDVGRLARAVLELHTGPLPSQDLLGDAALVPLLAGACPDVPPEVLAVLTEALASDRSLRPVDGLALAERMAVADGARALRERLGWLRGCHAAAGFDTHIGLLKSLNGQTNQDAYLALGDPDFALLAVFDGISQCNVGSGDRASAAAARAVRGWWEASADRLRGAGTEQVHAALAQAVAVANAAVCDAAAELAGPDLPRSIPMGTTCVIVVTAGNRVHLASAGDSRAYLVGRFGAAVLNTDDNVLGERLRGSLRGGPPVRAVDVRHALTSFIGRFDEDMEPDPPAAFARSVDLLPGEWLVLCSDGLVDYAAPEEAAVTRLLSRTVAEARGERPGAVAMDVARRLVTAANNGGGGDNVTVLALTLVTEYGAAPADGPVG